jgi:hypothetical protein
MRADAPVDKSLWSTLSASAAQCRRQSGTEWRIRNGSAHTLCFFYVWGDTAGRPVVSSDKKDDDVVYTSKPAHVAIGIKQG